MSTTFSELGVSDPIVEALRKRGIDEPFPIQSRAIPDAMAGRDVCSRARTGAGKTLAFGLPLIERAHQSPPRRPGALILVPTRELANQVFEELRPLAHAKGLFISTIYGGVSMNDQIRHLRRGVDIVVATPGRLIDLRDRREIDLDGVGAVVIDEADQMADLGFLPQVEDILSSIGGEHQTLLFSATLDGAVARLLDRYLDDPVRHEIDDELQRVDLMEHRFLRVHYMDKPKVAAAIARSAERTLVFCRTKAGADRVAKQLRDEGLGASPIHGDLPQNKRQRALDDFASGKRPVLVATNVAARGLHVDGVEVVIHYDPPEDPKTYVHRSGRTARAGEEGLVVTLVEWDQMLEVDRLQRKAGVHYPIVKMFSNDPRLEDLSAWAPDPDDATFPGDRKRKKR